MRSAAAPALPLSPSPSPKPLPLLPSPPPPPSPTQTPPIPLPHSLPSPSPPPLLHPSRRAWRRRKRPWAGGTNSVDLGAQGQEVTVSGGAGQQIGSSLPPPASFRQTSRWQGVRGTKSHLCSEAARSHRRSVRAAPRHGAAPSAIAAPPRRLRAGALAQPLGCGLWAVSPFGRGGSAWTICPSLFPWGSLSRPMPLYGLEGCLRGHHPSPAPAPVPAVWRVGSILEVQSGRPWERRGHRTWCRRGKRVAVSTWL